MLLLLLPVRLERFPHRGLVEQLLKARAAVAVDPPVLSYRRIARIPDAFAVTVALRQARRLRKRLREDPRALVIFDPAQYPLARALLALVPACELWYEETATAADTRTAELHALAAERADVRFAAADPRPLEDALGRLAERSLGRARH